MKLNYFALAAVAALCMFATIQPVSAATTSTVDTITYAAVKMTGSSTNLLTWSLDYEPTHCYIKAVFNTIQVAPTLMSGRLFVGGMSNDAIHVGALVAYTNAMFKGVASGDVVRCTLSGRQGIWITSTNASTENAVIYDVTLQKE